jgi:hypothetical protein
MLGEEVTEGGESETAGEKNGESRWQFMFVGKRPTVDADVTLGCHLLCWLRVRELVSMLSGNAFLGLSPSPWLGALQVCVPVSKAAISSDRGSTATTVITTRTKLVFKIGPYVFLTLPQTHNL